MSTGLGTNGPGAYFEGWWQGDRLIGSVIIGILYHMKSMIYLFSGNHIFEIENNQTFYEV